MTMQNDVPDAGSGETSLKNAEARDDDGKQILQAYGGAISRVPRIVSCLLSFVVLSYLVGWIRAQAYFKKFSANWLADQLTTHELIGFSILPLILLLFFAIWSVLHIAEHGTEAKKLNRQAALGLTIALVLTLLNEFLFKNFVPSLHVVTAYGAACGWAITCISFLNAAVLLLHERKFEIDHIIIWVLFYVSYLGLYFIPVHIGQAEAFRDLDKHRSSLSRVVIKEDGVSDWRLLRVAGDLMYVVRLADDRQDTSEVAIRVIEAKEADRIVGPKVK